MYSTGGLINQPCSDHKLTNNTVYPLITHWTQCVVTLLVPSDVPNSEGDSKGLISLTSVDILRTLSISHDIIWRNFYKEREREREREYYKCHESLITPPPPHTVI